MVVAARIQWLCEQLLCGKAVVVNFLPNATSGRLKVKVLVQPSDHPLPSPLAAHVYGVLQNLKALADSTTTVDRGHKHSNGTIEVAMWFEPRASVLRPEAEVFQPAVAEPRSASSPWQPVASPAEHVEPRHASTLWQPAATPAAMEVDDQSLVFALEPEDVCEQRVRASSFSTLEERVERAAELAVQSLQQQLAEETVMEAGDVFLWTHSAEGMAERAVFAVQGAVAEDVVTREMLRAYFAGGGGSGLGVREVMDAYLSLMREEAVRGSVPPASPGNQAASSAETVNAEEGEEDLDVLEPPRKWPRPR